MFWERENPIHIQDSGSTDMNALCEHMVIQANRCTIHRLIEQLTETSPPLEDLLLVITLTIKRINKSSMFQVLNLVFLEQGAQQACWLTMSQEQGQMLNFISQSNFNETQSDSSLKQVQTHFSINYWGGVEVQKSQAWHRISRSKSWVPWSRIIWLT